MDKEVEQAKDELELLNEMAEALLNTVHELTVTASTLEKMMMVAPPPRPEPTTESS